MLINVIEVVVVEMKPEEKDAYLNGYDAVDNAEDVAARIKRLNNYDPAKPTINANDILGAVAEVMGEKAAEINKD